jgi:hypothetical protein
MVDGGIAPEMSGLSMRKLLLEGATGAVALGAAQPAVLSALGEPTDRSVTKPLILRYGPLELTFIDDRLAYVSYTAGHASDARIEEDLPATRRSAKRDQR